jgi:hypothetical protein
LNRGGMRRAWLRAGENVQNRNPIQVATYNLGLGDTCPFWHRPAQNPRCPRRGSPVVGRCHRRACPFHYRAAEHPARPASVQPTRRRSFGSILWLKAGWTESTIHASSSAKPTGVWCRPLSSDLSGRCGSATRTWRTPAEECSRANAAQPTGRGTYPRECLRPIFPYSAEC